MKDIEKYTFEDFEVAAVKKTRDGFHVSHGEGTMKLPKSCHWVKAGALLRVFKCDGTSIGYASEYGELSFSESSQDFEKMFDEKRNENTEKGLIAILGSTGIGFALFLMWISMTEHQSWFFRAHANILFLSVFLSLLIFGITISFTLDQKMDLKKIDGGTRESYILANLPLKMKN